jgi:hypothetical protein
VRLCAVTGSSPGVGKSTVCTDLTHRLGKAGLRVDHFEEHEVLSRPEFTNVADEFRRTGFVTPQACLDAMSAYAATLRSGDWDVAVTDALVPFVPSLRASGYGEQEIAAFLHDLHEPLDPLAPVLVYLDGDPAAALSRASAREGGGWTDWLVARFAGFRNAPAVSDVDSAAAYLAEERKVTLTLLRDTGWSVDVISVDSGDTGASTRELCERITGPSS